MPTDSFRLKVKFFGDVEFFIAVVMVDIIGVLSHVLERLTVTSNPAKTPVSNDTVSCFALRSIEYLAVSPTLKTSLSVVSMTVDRRHIGVDESHVVLGDMET